MAFLKSGVSAQHGTRTFRLRRQNRRQRRERATRAERATRSPEAQSEATHSTRSTGHCGCFFYGGGWFEPQFPYHTAICSGGGGVSTSNPRPQSNWQKVWYLFLRDTTSSLVLGAGHYMSDRHNTPLLYSQETGIATTYCDATSPAPVEKKRLSSRKLPKGGPAKRVANSATPGLVGVRPSRTRFPKRGEKPLGPLPLPPFLPLPTLPPLYTSWISPSVILPLAAVSVSGSPSGSAWRSGESGAPPSLAQAPAERGKRGAVLQWRAGIETRVTCNTRRTRNTR